MADDTIQSVLAYKPLSAASAVRLVVLDKITGDDIIRCELINVDIAVNISRAYEALSYEWGLEDHDVPIYIDGVACYVRQNLFFALSYLRLKASKRTLWVDALCINQRDVAERSQQVGLMGQIYSQARDVLVWLGGPRTSSDLAFEYMRNIGRRPAGRGKGEHTATPQKAHGLQLEAMSAICDRSYWQRIWVVQEIQLAGHLVIHCGSANISWDAFTRACKVVRDGDAVKQLHSVKAIRNSLAVRFAGFRSMQQRLLKHWLRTCQSSLCSDPRDKVYGVLGLSDDCKDLLFPDYTKSLSDVYRAAVRAYSFDHALDGIGQHNILDFSEFLQNGLWSDDGIISLPYDDNETIAVCAVMAGQIDQIDRVPYRASSSDFTLRPRRIFEYQSSTREVRDTSPDLLAVRQMPFKLIQSNQEGSKSEVRLQQYQETHRQTQGSLSRSVTTSSATALIVQDFTIGAGMDRLIGAGPSCSAKGDFVCIFPGSRIAIILRPVDEHWVLLGRASMFKSYSISVKDAAQLWRHESGRVFPHEFDGRHAVVLQLDYAFLQRLTAHE